MKIPSEALGAIAVAASNISAKQHANTQPAAPALVDNSPAAKSIAPRPHLSRHLQRRLARATDSEFAPATDTRLLQAESSTTCDASFLRCILSETCRTCFQKLQENDVDWTNVVPDTPCQDVLGFLVAGGHCSEVKDGGSGEQDTFCSAFDSCVVWDEDDSAGAVDKDAEGDAEGEAGIDCSTLTECAWPGMHEQFLGDGVCHDAMPGCYNSKACNYDGGDCCEDTCHYPGQSGGTVDGDDYGECGQEGYACRDPSSLHCQPALATMFKEFCALEESADEDLFDDDMFKADESLPECSSSETLYRLVQYDSWGDGWDNTVLSLKEHDATGDPIYSGGLTFGSQGTVHLCLTKNTPKCYHFTVENGVWGNEISWELRPLAGGAPVLAAGGSPTDCTVPLGGKADDCDNTCDAARPDTKINDPNYKSYKDMEGCIENKCLIQVGNCAQDDSCSECMQDESPDYCFANENFNVLIDCSMCSCTEVRPAYCDAKSSGAAAAGASGSSAATHEGNLKPKAEGGGKSISGSATSATAVCGPEQTLQGTKSLVKFSECAKVDEMMVMVTEFDNDNFGMLDLFEQCAHTYNDELLHGGKSALDCMKILHNLIIDDEDETAEYAKNAQGEKLPEHIAMAISTLADHLYHDAESFCDCSGAVNKVTPMCSSFINFKTLLYEAVDACKSLDQIDCAAWEEFYSPCKKNLIQMYDAVNFDSKEQCDYVENFCGGAGPFPAFRRLDCGGEIAKPAWDFHTMYARGCLGSSAGSDSTTPAVYPTPTPPTPSSPTTKTYNKPTFSSPTATAEKKQYKPYNANGASDEKKPYYSSSDPEPDESATKKEKKKHHFFRNTFILAILAAVGYVVHKKRKDNFNYVRFRQLREARNYAGGLSGSAGAGDYAGVSMADSCSFEPPTLPPTPSDNTTMI